MSQQVPQIFGATATTTPVTYTVSPARRQFLIEHLQVSFLRLRHAQRMNTQRITV